jgi:hypothetical protein
MGYLSRVKSHQERQRTPRMRNVSAPVRVEPIHCLKCGRKFQTESALHNHMKFYHKELMV